MASLEDEKAAILKVIEDETLAFYEKDYERNSTFHVQEDYARRWGWWSRGGITARNGWTAIGGRTREMMQRNPKPNDIGRTVRRENVMIRVGKDMAWVTFDQYQPEHDEPEMDMPGLCRELRILEKHDGKWKIAMLLYLHRVLEDEEGALLRVDEHGKVLWQNAEATAAMAGGDRLTIDGGRLRAIDRGADQRLRAAWKWAAVRGENLDPRRGELPVVIEGGYGEPATICWVIAEDSMILVAINDEKLSEERLDMASVIYGITPAQRRLASHIVGGLDLGQAAERLGVSVNTARTQLQRMFEKTGVRSQPALVRALLSTGMPGR